MADLNALNLILDELKPYGASLVAVSKKQSNDSILSVFHHGHMHFGENYVQELLEKHQQLPDDIHWHFIGHLQSNKVKVIAPFVHLIHGVDTEKLVTEINKQAVKNNKVIDILLQVHIAQESAKFGFSHEECLIFVKQFFKTPLPGIQIRGLMGMATFTGDESIIRNEFKSLRKLYDTISSDAGENFDILSMGMSSDYKIALEEGSTMVRIGSLVFGAR